MMEMKNGNTQKLAVGKLEGERPPGRRRIRWDYNTKMDLTLVQFVGAD